MVIKLLMIYKKRMRYHLTAHPLFYILWIFVSLCTVILSRDGIPLIPKPP